ncbi:hypothetical protein RUM43_009577 [Polyplax serrata]|uniref:Rab3 GTPase-activating protein catalytic subunit n=1 Tax=Polyplax serrata TaxID=468196 RepID=A0AAN8P8P6_POLSC
MGLEEPEPGHLPQVLRHLMGSSVCDVYLLRLEFQVPDSKTCLLNQKLQLLNCCISRRIQRDRQASERTQGDSESEEEDEFFDCCDGDNEENEGKGRKVKTTTAGKPMGRLAKHGDMKLLETGEPLYIPVTQDSVPKTEDQLEEDTQVLVKLGSDALGSELRAKLLSAYLLSDMEAFKAANPGCILADFIRWCSPRDWIENEDGELDDFGQKKGHLSHRMEIPGNTWQEVWEVARPSPAKWQKRLFNDTREAEKILDYLERKTPSEFVKLLLPVFSVCVLQKLLDEMTDELPGLNDVVTKLIKKAERFSRMSTIDEESYKDLVNDISGVETSLVHLKSLKRKFTYKKNEPDPEVMEFIKSLLTTGETEVPGGPKSKIATMIRNFFSEAAKADPIVWDTESQLTSEKWNVMSPFLSPNEKEMILRVSTAQGPQRLHAILKKNECRICGAFTSNVFFPNN